MSFKRVLIANRGEIAIRIARSLADLGITSVAIYSEDDQDALHPCKADQAVAIPGRGSAAYLNGEAVIAAARQSGCDAVHPGYGFLSENADFARLCERSGLTFIGPHPDSLDLFGDKIASRRLAREVGVPVIAGTDQATTLEQAKAFFADHPDGMVIKAMAGGGGRGIRVVRDAAEIEAAFSRCQSEALASFANDALYLEALIQDARHIEVQIIGDGESVIHLGERDCSLQRRQQKLIEITPAPGLAPPLREALCQAAVRLAEWVDYRNLGTVEFLQRGDEFWFIETNPRLQVEHTITEMVSGVDLVNTQIRLAEGAHLDDLGLNASPKLHGSAIQLRINAESMQPDGSGLPSAGRIDAWDTPGGPGIRIDAQGFQGGRINPHFDSLLAKLIVQQTDTDLPALLRRARRALADFRIDGVETNIAFLHALLGQQQVQDYRVTTGFINELPASLFSHPALPRRHPLPAKSHKVTTQEIETPPGCIALTSGVAGTLSQLDRAEGDAVHAGEIVAIVEAMKMEFEIRAPASGSVRLAGQKVGDLLAPDDLLLFIETDDQQDDADDLDHALDLDAMPARLAEVLQRQQALLDEQRPEAVAKRHKLDMRTARENLDALLDPGSFNEYGGLAIAAQRQRRKLSELEKISPADGLVAGTGTINAEQFGEEKARCMAMAYDYTVFAGTQGMMNHKKTDRLLQLAEKWRLPLVLYAEGGGGRPGETDFPGVAGLDNMTFLGLARLSGLVPLISVVNGRCFAGNAALAGCCDVIIATENSSLGMAGPAMIEGGGLGRYKPEEVGPPSIQGANGVIDVLVKDEAEATAMARQYLGYFQGCTDNWQNTDQRHLRHLIPENRLRGYDMRKLIETLADTDSVLELRRQFAAGMITALIRIGGKPFGLIANNPMHLGGAIDSDASDKAARFMQLCDAFDLPMISLCDTPGFMVGPEAEKTASVRHMSRLFNTAASLDIPFFTVVVRKGYGLGAQAMAAGSFHAPVFSIAWPSGEFGAMGLEGAVRLGYAKELAAIEDPRKREKLFNRMVRSAYQHGKALNMASYLEIDNVIDPLETRDWLLRGLASTPAAPTRYQRKRPMIDPW